MVHAWGQLLTPPCVAPRPPCQVLCGGDPATIKYSLQWWAHNLQHPEHKIGVAPIYRGPQVAWPALCCGGVWLAITAHVQWQGTGKGIWISTIGQMLAPHFVQLSSHRQLLGQFNGILANRCIIFLDEVRGAVPACLAS